MIAFAVTNVISGIILSVPISPILNFLNTLMPPKAPGLVPLVRKNYVSTVTVAPSINLKLTVVSAKICTIMYVLVSSSLRKRMIGYVNPVVHLCFHFIMLTTKL